MKKLLALILCFAFISSVSAQTFVDVDPSNWAYPFVEDMVAQGIVEEGYFFHPQNYVTRAEMVKMMVLATTGILDDQLPKTQSFPDVSWEDWYYPYVETAKLTGLIDGYADGFFRPERQVIRAEAVKIIVNGLGIPKSVDPPVNFRDYPNDAWFHIYVASAYNKGIVSGLANSKGTPQMMFAPSDPVTRAGISKVLSNGLAASTLY